jgi:small subunit ribosomal protein S1
VVAIGDTVRIKVLDIDRDRQRISLGLKQTQEDPWQRVISTHRPGDVLEGQVTKVVAFGAFVEILPGVEGLVHISELADHHVENPSEVVEPGTSLNVKILEIDEERRRLSLSIKRVEGQNMPMQDLGAQIAEAEGVEGVEGTEVGEAAEAPVAEEAQIEAPAEEPVAEEAPAEEAPAEEPAADVTEETAAEVVEEPVAEVAEEPAVAEEPVAEEPAAEAENGEASEEDAGEAHEGETVADRPDSPDDVDEAPGETPESEPETDS